MSAQDQRTEIILKCIPQLVKELTGFDDEDENLYHCEQFAWNIIRCHRNLSTNGHDVRRRIEGLQERFRVDNCAIYADYLGRLCDEITRHPLCIDHYEVDVHWSLLDFLITLAYNPTVALRRNKHKIDLNLPQPYEDTGKANNELIYWKNVLKEHFITTTSYEDSNSELSEWSDEDGNTDECEQTAALKIKASDHQGDNGVLSHRMLGNVKPPQKSNPFVEFDDNNPRTQLWDTVQHSWWLAGRNSQCQAMLESRHIEANFSQYYSRFLNETSNNLIRFQTPSTITEQHLMRELLWMFHKPSKCSIFDLDEQHNVIRRQSFTIPSVTGEGLSKYLESQFIPYIRMMETLSIFHKSIYDGSNRSPPRTVECYAANLHLHLKPIWAQLLNYERRLLQQQDLEINTIINMRAYLNDAFIRLQCLYDIHQQVILSWEQYPPHICSALLLAGLTKCFQMENNITNANLAMSLLLASIKVFCEIIDTWWSEGRLDDWQQEYIVERISDVDQSVCMRKYRKNKPKLFFVPSQATKSILENSLFLLMQEHSLEAGRTLNLLYEINRIGNLRNTCDAVEGKLYNTFIKDFLQQVRTMQKEIKIQSQPSSSKQHDDESECYNDPFISTSEIKMKTKSVLSNLTTNDEFLLMSFALNSNETEAPRIMPNKTLNALDIFKQLQRSLCSLPLEELLIKTLTQILNRRIELANSFVMKLYRDEFMILTHLQNLRKVLLLEASDVMYQFYSRLFKQIESGLPWANPSLLTMQLDDIISTRFPEMSSLFRVELISMFNYQTTKVSEAVDELMVTYNFSRELKLIINGEDIEAYNKVFRFLLKVKWGITILERLSFPRSRKRPTPYADFNMIDLVMRRLEQLRFWMMYALQSVHFHLMTHVLQSMGDQLDKKINQCQNLKDLEMVHKSYLSTVCEHCFLVDNLNAIKVGVEQLLNLTCILNLEWVSCTQCLETKNPLSIDIHDKSNGDSNIDDDYVDNTQIDAIELTYIRCHQYLANKLNNEVYLKRKSFLSGLSAAFNTSLPY
uniref:Gamma-tubulin complex component n=1 Tax=Glossina morsitans morsitans TaxID=37546 RepID=A0A1B0G349_GLOMM